MQLLIAFCNSYMHDDYITVMRMSSDSPWGAWGRTPGQLAGFSNGRCKGNNFSQGWGNLTRQSLLGQVLLNEKSPWYHLKNLGFTWLIHFDFNCTSSLLSWRSLLRTTANMGPQKHPWTEFGYKAARRMGEFLSREATIGKCDPASDAFFSRNKDRCVYINKWYSDYRSKRRALPQNLLFVW